MAHVRLPSVFLAFTVSTFMAVTGLASAQSAFVPDASAAAAPTQANRVADSARLGSPAVLPGHIPQWASAQNDVGEIPATQRVPIIVNLARAPQVEAAFKQLVDDQQNTASPHYHQWLTPQQVGDQFGPTQHDVDAVTAWLTAQGFTIDSVVPSRMAIQASAPAGLVASAFHTSLHSFAMKNGTSLQAPTAEPSVPAALSSVIGYIDGLSNVPRHTHNVQGNAEQTAAAVRDLAARRAASTSGSATGPANAQPDVNLTGNSGTYHGLLPADFAAIYDINPAYSAGVNGTGQRIAIIGGSDLLASDIANYEALSGLASYTPTTIVPPSTANYTFSDPGYVSNDQTEGMLDFERAYSTAPGAQIDFIISKGWLNGTTSQGLVLYAINTVNDPVMSLSFGACEALQTPAYIAYENSTFMQAASQGMSVFISSGDAGVEGCAGLNGSTPTLYASISDYCASAYVTCVGATEFNDVPTSTFWSNSNGTNYLSALGYIPEGAWNDPIASQTATTTTYQLSSTGGGFSVNQPKPSWQVGTGVPADGHRDVPDISFSGSLHNAYVVCQASAGSNTGCAAPSIGFIIVGGTSASAPSMGGIAALIDQKLKGRQGNMNPLLYAQFAKNPAAFHDATPVSSGAATNGVCATTTPTLCNNTVPQTTTALTPVVTGYPVTVGYDLTTGLGSLDVNAFLTSAGTPVPVGTITATPTTATNTQTEVFTVTFAPPAGATGTPTGTVQFFSNGVALGTPVTLTSGTASTPAVNLTPAATYAISATYSGDANFSPASSATLNFVVTNPIAIASASALTVTPSGTITSVQPVTYSVTVTGKGATPTGTVSFLDGAVVRSSATLSGGAATFTTPAGLTSGAHTLSCMYSGDGTYAASTCNSIALTVNAVATTTAAAITPSTITAGGSYAVTFTVSGAGGTPTGSVAVYAAGSSPTLLTTIALQGSNVATYSVSNVLPGVYSYTGVYSGDPYFSSSTSPTVGITVSGFAMTSTPATLSFLDGATAGNAVTVGYTSIGGFAGAISQSCSLSLNSGVASLAPTCTITPATVSLASGGTGMATVAVVTQASVARLETPPGATRDSALGGIAFAGLLLLILPNRRRLLQNGRLLTLLLLVSAAMLAVSGCGGGSSNTASGSSGTTRGTYTLTVKGVSGTATNTTTAQVTIN